MNSWLKELLGYRNITLNGSPPYPARDTVDFTGNVTIADTNLRTVITVGAGGGGSTAFGLKAVCKVATTANVALSGLITVDGIPLNVDDRVLVRAQTTLSQNGIYLAKETGWVRADDANENAELPPATIVPVDQGTLGSDSLWRLTTNAPIIVGTSLLSFSRFDGSDARSLRGVNVFEDAPVFADVLTYDGTSWLPQRIFNEQVDANAAIEPAKLQGGGEFEVLQTLGGVALWGGLTQASITQTLADADPISVSQNNYSPTDWDTCSVCRLNSGETAGPIYLNGFGPAAVKRKLLINASAISFAIPNLAGGQAAGNQARTPSGGDFVLHPRSSAEVVYDTFSACWRVVGVDPLEHEVVQWHDVPLETFASGSPVADSNFGFGHDTDVGGEQIISLSGWGDTRAWWNMTRWAGELLSVQVDLYIGAPGDPVSTAPGSATLYKLTVPNTGFAGAKRTGGTPAAQVPISVSLGGKTVTLTPATPIPLDPSTGAGATLYVRANSGTTGTAILRIRAQIRHTNLAPLP